MKRILIIHRGSLGDFLLTLPALAAIKQNFPHSRIEALGRPEILSLLCPGFLESAHFVEQSAYLPLFENANLPPRTSAFLRSFDSVLAFVKDHEDHLWRSLIALSISNILVQPPFPAEDRRIHVARYLLELVVPFLEQNHDASMINFLSSGSSDIFHFTQDEREQADHFLAQREVPPVAPVAIHAGSGSERKCWPFERFEALARLISKSGRGILFILGPADERLAPKVGRLVYELHAALAHSLPLRQLAAVLSRCSAYIGNDSGISHLAALLGIPTVAIFGPTDPAVWRPVGPKVRVLQGGADCSPCMRGKMLECGRRICLEAVSVETAAEEMERAPAPLAP